MKEMILTKGKMALVDDEDYERLSKWKWSYANVGYAVRNERGRIIYMHRFILNATTGKEVDHWDEDKLNNQKTNLRVCTPRQNKGNCGKRKGNYTSSHKGVIWRKDRNKWRAEITVNYKNIFLGHFEKEEDASRAYQSAHKKHFGEFSIF